MPSATSGLAQSIYNTADARITGGELELRLAPAAGLELSANLGLTDAYFQVYKGAALLAVLSAQLLLRRLATEEVRRRQEAEQLHAEARGYA